MALPKRTKLRRTVREGTEATSAWRRDEGRCCRGRGGAGGLLGAYHAARAGLEVLLLDQHERRQDRADGDALFPRAVAKCRSWASLTCSRGRTTTSMRALWCTPAR